MYENAFSCGFVLQRLEAKKCWCSSKMRKKFSFGQKVSKKLIRMWTTGLLSAPGR